MLGRPTVVLSNYATRPEKINYRGPVLARSIPPDYNRISGILQEATLNCPVMVVHGGAWYIPPRLHAAYQEGCRRAALLGWECLTHGGSALDAVEAAVASLENETTYDAGRGSYFNAADEVEMDAIIMDGRTLTFGAVAAIQHVPNPVRVARLVMERTPHHFIVGQGATAFAREMGLLVTDPELAVGKRELEEEEWTPPGDTVGAVALDLSGNLAVATSTGGTPNKRPGRVGDSPLVGAGAYADNLAGAAGATGSGEHLMRVVISKAACDRMAAGMSAQQAAEEAIRLLQSRVNGYGGLIAIDREGRVGLAHNTPNLAYAYRLPDQEIMVGMSVLSRQ